jgi:hypothetical protein
MSGHSEASTINDSLAANVNHTAANEESSIARLNQRSTNTNRRLNLTEHYLKNLKDQVNQGLGLVNGKISDIEADQQHTHDLLNNFQSHLEDQGRQIDAIGRREEELANQEIAHYNDTIQKIRETGEKIHQTNGRLNDEQAIRARQIRQANARIDSVQAQSAQNQRELRNFRAQAVREMAEINENSVKRDRELQKMMEQGFEHDRQERERMRKDYNQKFQIVQNNLNNYIKQQESNQARKHQVAMSYITACQTIYATIQKTHHSTFFPRRLDEFQRRIQDIKDQAASQSNEAAISGGSIAYQELITFYDDVMEKEAELNFENEMVLRNLSELATTMSYLWNVVYESPVSITPVEGKIDFWTHGKLTEIKNEAETLDKSFRTLLQQDATIENLRKMATEAERLKMEALKAENEAKAAYLASNYRKAVGNTIYQTLVRDHNYKCGKEDFAWKDDDPGKDLHFVLSKEEDGTKISVVIKSDPADVTQTSIETKILYPGNDPQFYDRLTDRIYEGLESNGKHVAQHTCDHGATYAKLKNDIEAFNIRKLVDTNKK